MQLQNLDSEDECVQLKQISEWIASIEDRTVGGPNDGVAIVNILDDILVKCTNEPVATIVESIYPSFTSNIDDMTYLQKRAILEPTLDVVESVNQYMVSKNAYEGRIYLSSYTTYKSDTNIDLLQDVNTSEFLNGLRCSDLPNHELNLKVGTPVMLLRYIDHVNSLCNGTKLVIIGLESHVLEAKTLTGQNVGHKVLILRMSLTPSDPRLPFKFQQR